MNILLYIYILPLTAAFYFITKALWVKIKADNRIIQAFSVGKREAVSQLDKLTGFIFPQKSAVRQFYNQHILFYSNLSFDTLIKFKLIIFLGVFILAVLIKYTNVSIQTDEILNKYDYKVDMLLQEDIKDKNSAMLEEKNYLEQAMAEIGHNVLTLSKDSVESIIKGMMMDKKASDLEASVDTITNKVYYRLYDYYFIRHYHILFYFMTALLLSFMLELFFILLNFIRKSDTKKELRFLKKLIILNGSIKPVDFMEVLKILIHRSIYYRKVLQDIEDKNRRNSIDTRTVYQGLYASAGSINEKLFFEKLDEANNYDFDQAVKNISYEFTLEKKELERAVRKRIEVIHVIGVTGFLLIILIMVIYLIQPWLSMYDIRQLGI